MKNDEKGRKEGKKEKVAEAPVLACCLWSVPTMSETLDIGRR